MTPIITPLPQEVEIWTKTIDLVVRGVAKEYIEIRGSNITRRKKRGGGTERRDEEPLSRGHTYFGVKKVKRCTNEDSRTKRKMSDVIL